MKRLDFLAIRLFVLAVASVALAQTSSYSGLTGVEGPIVSETYKVMPGDCFLVTVNGGIAYSYSTWITYEGKITVNIPLDPTKLSEDNAIQPVDAIAVSGLTMRQAQDSLARVFRRYFTGASVKLTLTGMRSSVIFVTGEVQNPGVVYASPVERVSQILAKAGGLTPIGSKAGIQVFRGDSLVQNANIEQFESEGTLSTNPFVESGDRIHVPAVAGSVTVKGAVFGRGEYRLRTSALTTEKERVSEGIYELNSGDRALDLVRRAGGATPWADLPTSYISRRDEHSPGGRKRIDVDLARIMFQGDTAGNVLMQNDDILVIPPINTLVYVEGEVVKAGSYLYTPNLKFNDYIGLAGGPTAYAYVNAAHVRRAGKRISGKTNPTIEPGDIVLVPRVGFKWWQDYVTILSAVGVPVATTIVSLAISSWKP